MNELPIFSGAECVVRDDLIPAIPAYQKSQRHPTDGATETLLTAAALTFCIVVSFVSPPTTSQQTQSAVTTSHHSHSAAHATTEGQDGQDNLADSNADMVESALASFAAFVDELEAGAPQFAEAASRIAGAPPCVSTDDAEAWARRVLNTDSLS